MKKEFLSYLTSLIQESNITATDLIVSDDLRIRESIDIPHTLRILHEKKVIPSKEYKALSEIFA